MIAVISDLHFEEESRDVIRGEDGQDEISVPRNIPAAPYRRLVEDLARAAKRNDAEHLRLVLAGDVFELYQTALWFEDEDPPRPYQATIEAGSALERKLLSILDATMEEQPVKETLKLFHDLLEGRYREGSEEKEFPVPVSIEYIPGNHDRPVNATPALRRRVRELLRIDGGGDRLPNYLLLENPSALIRHGHEYDPYNFSVDYTEAERIPLHIPREHYDAPTLGDFITIEVVARLPVEYRRVHSPKEILSDPLKRAVYTRLLEFEDVRPQSALLPYLLRMPKRGFSEDDIWATLEPVVQNILDAIHDHPFLHEWLDKRGTSWRPDRMDVAGLALKLLSWRSGMSLAEAKMLGWAAGQAEKSVVAAAAREEAVQEGMVSSIICGHTHTPAMEVATMHGLHECRFFDVGTWRQRHPMAHDQSGFGSNKSLTYLILYGSRDGSAEDEAEAFDYWTGVAADFTN